MMVVMQFLATDQDAPGQDVRAGIFAAEVAIAPEMADAVNDAGGPERNPRDLQREHDDAGHDAEKRDIDQAHDGEAGQRIARIDIALHPVIRSAVAIARHGFFIFGLGPVQLCALEQDFTNAVHLRAVRILGLLALSVVFAVNRRPLFGHLTRSQPEPEPEKMRHCGVQIQSPVRLVPV